MDQVDEHVFISGQIGMIPKDLSVPNPPNVQLETALAAQHTRRILRAICENSGGLDWGLGHCQFSIYWLSDE